MKSSMKFVGRGAVIESMLLVGGWLSEGFVDSEVAEALVDERCREGRARAGMT